MTIKISSHTRPAIYTHSDGTLFAVPSWIPLPPGTTLNDLEWVPPVSRKVPPVQGRAKKVIVLGSKGDRYVVTTFPNGNKTCTCMGYSYRKTCKHIRGN
jgi:hypothetical protein